MGKYTSVVELGGKDGCVTEMFKNCSSYCVDILKVRFVVRIVDASYKDRLYGLSYNKCIGIST